MGGTHSHSSRRNWENIGRINKKQKVEFIDPLIDSHLLTV